MSVWTKDFPTEPGHYWFYGYRYGKRSPMYDVEPEYKHVEVIMGGNGPVYVAEGQFMSKSEVEEAYFMPFNFPEPPIK